MLRVARKAGEANPGHAGVSLEKAGDLERVGLGALHPEPESLDSPEDEPGLVRVHRSSEEVMDLPETLEMLRPLRHDGAADDVRVAVQVLREAVDHDVGPESERLLENRRRERVVDDEKRPPGVRDLRALREIGELHRRVRRRLDVDHPRRGPHRRSDVPGVRGVDPGRRDAEPAVLVLEDEARRAVDRVRADDVRSGLEEA